MAVGASDNLFVSKQTDGAIQKVTQGRVITPFTNGLSTPLGLAFDAAGLLDSADSGDGTIQRITSFRRESLRHGPEPADVRGGSNDRAELAENILAMVKLAMLERLLKALLPDRA